MGELQTKINVSKILVLFIIGLLIANFTLKTLYPSPAIWITATLAFFIYSYVNFINKKNLTYFILFILFASHFSIGQNQGGLFNILLFTGVLIRLLTGDISLIQNIRKVPILLNSLILALFFLQLLSSFLYNTGSFSQQLFGDISFISCILVFYYSINLSKNEYLQILIKVIVYLAIYNLLIAINQRFFGIFINSPLVPLVIQEQGYLSTASSGTIGSSALFGEFYAIVFIFLFCIKYLTSYGQILKSRILTIGVFASIFNIVLSNSRSTVILAAGMIVVISLVLLIKKRELSPLFKMSVSLLFIFLIGSYIGVFDVIASKLQQIDFANITFQGISSGEDINRGIIFTNGIKRLTENSWFLGNGYGVFETNAQAWFGEFGFSFYGKGSELYDIHSLYLALPMLFGWIGTVCFIVIMLYIIIKLRSSLKTTSIHKYGLVFGLMLVWFVFLINEYKVNATALPNYFLLIWSLLGLSLGVIIDRPAIRK